MPKKTPNNLRGLAEVRSGKRPSLKQALSKVLGQGAYDLDGIMSRLEKRGWLPSSHNPRKYVGETLSKEKALFVRGPDGLYRSKTAAPKRKKRKARALKIETTPVALNPSIAIIPVEVPKQFERGLRDLATYTGKPTKALIGEIIIASLRGRINSMYDAMKIPDVLDVDKSTDELLAEAGFDLTTVAPKPPQARVKAKLSRGRFEWNETADAALVRIVASRKLVTWRGRKAYSDGGWPGIARELSTIVGHKLSRLAVFKHWQWLQDKPAYRKKLASAPKGKRVSKSPSGRFAWSSDHDKILATLVHNTTPRRHGKRVFLGWEDIAKKFSTMVGVVVTGQACLTRWHRVSPHMKNGKSMVPIDAVFARAGVETVSTVAQG